MNSPKIIRRFVFLELLKTTFLATLILTGVLLYGNAVRAHESLFQALSLSPGLFLQLIGFLVPYSMSYGIPFGFALAILLCFGRWSSDNEILAMRSLGLGIGDWGKPVFSLSIFLSALCLYANLQWAPVNRSLFDQKMEEVLWTNLNAVWKRRRNRFAIGDDLNEESGASSSSWGRSFKVSFLWERFGTRNGKTYESSFSERQVICFRSFMQAWNRGKI